MTSEQPIEQPVREYLRWKSDYFKFFGFRYSTDRPLLRCRAGFNLDRLKDVMFEQMPGIEVLDFTMKTGEEIRFHLDGLRNYDESDFSEPWIGTPAETGVDRYFLVEGTQINPSGDWIDIDTIDNDATADADREWGWTPPSRNRYRIRHILALVAFGRDGEPLSSIVQILPSPAEQLVYIPAP